MKKVIIVLLVLVLAAAAAVLAACALSGDDSKYTHGSQVEIKETIENLKIDWTAGKVTIAYHSGNTILVEEKTSRTVSEDEQMRWRVDGKTLEIMYNKPGLNITLQPVVKELTVTLPEGTRFEKADIGATSADIVVPAISAKTLELGSTSGNVDATAEAETVKAEMTSGNLKLTLTGEQKSVSLGSTSGEIACTLEKAETVKVGSTSGGCALEAGEAGKLEIGSTSGTVSAAVKAFKEIKIGSTSGSVELSLPAEPGFTAKLESVSGNVATELAMSRNGETYTCGDGSGKVEVGTTSGSIRIREIK